MKEMIIAKGINKKIQWTSDFLWDFFHDVNFTIYKGEFVVIAGDSGSGKTTLLGILLGYDKQAEGTVFVNNVNISDMDEIELEKFRSENIGLCYEYKAPINLNHTVKENIYSRLKCFGNRDIEEECEEIIRIFNLTSISNQKVLLGTDIDYYRLILAVAFCGTPPIIIIDETLDYFPVDERKELLMTIMFLQKKHQITMVMVTHNIEIVKQADRALCMKDKTMYKVDLDKLRRLTDTK